VYIEGRGASRSHSKFFASVQDSATGDATAIAKKLLHFFTADFKDFSTKKQKDLEI